MNFEVVNVITMACVVRCVMTIEHLKNDEREREKIAIDSTVCCRSSSSSSVTTAISQTIVHLCIRYTCACECVRNVYKIKRKKWESIILTVCVFHRRYVNFVPIHSFIKNTSTTWNASNYVLFQFEWISVVRGAGAKWDAHICCFSFWCVFVIFGLFIRCHFSFIHIHLFAINVLICEYGK